MSKVPFEMSFLNENQNLMAQKSLIDCLIRIKKNNNNVSSHKRLLHFLEKHSDASVFVHVYTKPQLISLCMAYEVRFKQRDTKKVLATTLVETLKKATCRSIPFTALVDDRQFEVVRTISDEADGGLLMRFRLTGNY